MKNLMLILALSVFGYTIANAQVKRQYQDTDHASTMVVVKEDGMTDVDVLNSQFNLNDISMGQVIRITTEGTIVTDGDYSEAPPVQEVKAVDRAPEKPVVEEVEETIVITEVEEPTAPIEAPKMVSNVVKADKNRTSTGRIAYNDAPSGTYRHMSEVKRPKTKRVRLKKNKRAKRNNYRKCFAF